jgi:DNA excision repair protein ERCC-3
MPVDRPLIVQSDKTVLLSTDSRLYPEARDFLAKFAELERSPEHYHTYRITPLSLWNAAAAGTNPREIYRGMTRFSQYDLPGNVVFEIEEQMSRYGLLRLERFGRELLLVGDDETLLRRLGRNPSVGRFFGSRRAEGFVVPIGMRGRLKVALLKLGWPVEDIAGYTPGAPHDIKLLTTTRSGYPFELRHYQSDAAEIFFAGGSQRGGSGVVVLPCGAGKTIVGMAAMALLKKHVLIVTTGVTATRQWMRELHDKTTLSYDEMGEYTGYKKEVKPITITTYQTVTYRRKKTGPFPHFDLFTTRDWGLIIYDEVHLLPAPVFRITAEIQARRRLGLTATLVREDRREGEVFSLIGPKRYDVPWKDLEQSGWIARAICYEIRTALDPAVEEDYFNESPRRQQRIAGSNPRKDDVVERLLKRHEADKILVIGLYLEQLHRMAERFALPLIAGETPQHRRDTLYEQFRQGKLNCLIVSKVGNFAVDLPEANVAIQVSGSFGSRQEEAQRLGRILRPKPDGAPARFYSLVTSRTQDESYGAKRQLFLTEQGYRYFVVKDDELHQLNELV